MAGADYSCFIFKNGVLQTDFPQSQYMGAGRVVASFNKYWPELVIDGEAKHMDALRLFPVEWDAPSEWFLEMDGYRWQARESGPTALDMELVEPDGTIWQGRGGYAVGFGYDDIGGGTPEQFYEQVKRSRFRWTQVAQPTATADADKG